MKRELVIKKCNSCGAIVKVVNDCNCGDCGIICCDEKMQKLVPNSVDAAVEKHIPTYEIEGNEIVVKVNHVMEDEHFIEWVTLVSENKEEIVMFAPGKVAEARFEYIPGTTVYAYCNKHGLWKKDVE